jgi:translation initiation factor IF-2
LAEKLGLRPNRLIADLMQLNILASINQRVEVDVAQKIADKYGFKIEIVRQKRSDRTEAGAPQRGTPTTPFQDDKPEDFGPRRLVVTFLGHVDHGKTSLMDRIRHTASPLARRGGITQAYRCVFGRGEGPYDHVFGHARTCGFSAMRVRAARIDGHRGDHHCCRTMASCPRLAK